jgi:hypothetical protein
MMIKSVTASSLCLFLAVACNHNDAVDQPTTTGGAYNSPSSPAAPVSERAADEIASARCDREVTCNNVGVSRKYSTREVCVAQLRAENQNDMTNASCPNGISRPALDKCLADVRAEQCNHPLDTLERLHACMRSTLCP